MGDGGAYALMKLEEVRSAIWDFGLRYPPTSVERQWASTVLYGDRMLLDEMNYVTVEDAGWGGSS